MWVINFVPECLDYMHRLMKLVTEAALTVSLRTFLTFNSP